jgi:hypothetical protein
MKQAALRDMFKKASKSVHTSSVVAPPDPLSPIPSTSAMKTTENTMESTSDQLCSSGTGAVTKNYLQELGSV